MATAEACGVDDSFRRVIQNDKTLEWIELSSMRYSDDIVAPLFDALIDRASELEVETLLVDCNQLTDETGVKLAHFIAASPTVRSVHMATNQFGEKTYLAVAAALKANTTLRLLYLYGNSSVCESLVDFAFVDALRINPLRPSHSAWRLLSIRNEFAQLEQEAHELGHPTLQMLLVARLEDSSLRVRTSLKNV